MAMTRNGEYQIAAPREVVWDKLNDPEVLKVCIPGCESLEKLSDTEFQAVAVTKIGPVKAKFKGKVNLTDLDPPNGYKISGAGDGGIAGFAKGGAVVALIPKDGGTLLTYNVEAQISAWSTAPRKKWPTSFSRNSPPRPRCPPPERPACAP
jgi:uncharacterized protein